MVYPSHYQHGVYGVSRPNGAPYLMVRRALQDGQRRSRAIAGPTAEIRPYLQAFTLGQPRYTPQYVKDQIRYVIPYEQSPDMAVKPCMPGDSAMGSLRIASHANNNAAAQPKRKPTA